MKKEKNPNKTFDIKKFKEMAESAYTLLTSEQIIGILKDYAIFVTFRTINYYKTLGLIPKPCPRAENPKGDKRGHYHKDVLLDLAAIHFLRHYCGLSLGEIKKFRNNAVSEEYRYMFYSELLSTYTSLWRKLEDFDRIRNMQTLNMLLRVPAILLFNRLFIETLRETGLPQVKYLGKWGPNKFSINGEDVKKAEGEKQKLLDELVEKILNKIFKISEKEDKTGLYMPFDY